MNPTLPSELAWRGLSLRPFVTPHDSPLEAILRAGRWEVALNRDGKWVAHWCYQATSIGSVRETALEALEALVRYLEESLPVREPTDVLAMLREDLVQLSAVAGREPVE